MNLAAFQFFSPCLAWLKHAARKQQGAKRLVFFWVASCFWAVSFTLAAEHCLQVYLWLVFVATPWETFFISQPLAGASHVSTGSPSMAELCGPFQ